MAVPDLVWVVDISGMHKSYPTLVSRFVKIVLGYNDQVVVWGFAFKSDVPKLRQLVCAIEETPATSILESKEAEDACFVDIQHEAMSRNASKNLPGLKQVLS